jgi:regulator of protease activity HflC (stomatin/prohibitin superfamily)
MLDFEQPELTWLEQIGAFIGWIFGNIPLIILVILLLVLLIKSVEIVPHKGAQVVERLGRYHRTLQAGPHLVIPFVDKLSPVIDLEQLQIDVKATVKTNEDQFITLPVTVFYRVIQDRAHDSIYEVMKPKDAIRSLVQGEVKSTAATMNLQQIFDSRDTIKEAVEQTLRNEIVSYGFEVRNVVIDNPEIPDALTEAFNNVTVAQQSLRAATAEADALRIKLVGEATAQGESLVIQGQSYVKMRTDIAKGSVAAIEEMIGKTDLTPHQVLQFMTVIDSNDAVRDAAGKGATVVVATGHAPDSLLSTLPRES